VVVRPRTAPAEWDAVADVLLARVVTDVVREEARDIELAADAGNERLHELALRHGFRRGKPSCALEIGTDAISRLPRADVPALAGAQHTELVALHDLLFPGTYYSGRQVVEQHERGEAIVLALMEEGRLTGYAVGRIDSAGEGYLDFLGVAEDARGSGLGRRLVTAICRRLVDAGARSKVSLTVYEDNAPALALYERLGFTRAASLVGYRRRPNDAESS
jgi:ribosomal protein S18 acetylase RimI-like enzyme